MTRRNFQTLKVGGYVKVKSDLVINMVYNGLSFVPEMADTRGKILRIKYFDNSGDYLVLYGKNIDWAYSPEMLDYSFKFGR